MLCHRVVPCLDVANGRVVKGTNFVDLVDEGDPPELAERYAREGADELVFLDITAAPEGRGTLLDIVERTARRAFIPLTVGGGVRHVNEMRDVLRAGADKVSLNTAAVADPDLVKRCARRFGRQAVVVAIDARRLTKEAYAAEVRARPARTGFAAANANRVRDRAAGGVYNDDAQSGTWEVFVRGGRVATGMNAVGWAERAAALGAGELLVTSIDRDGTRSGYDTELLRAISDRVSVPVVASGGAAGPADFVAAVRDGHADAVLAASIFHRRMHSIADVKAAMAAAGISVRIDGRTAA
jgi:cyclase